ncbi:amidohydrolase family protein [Helicobacter pametensis]|uniref:amidohydrolase family protein n=1 Tax=Helicobacter pametensis TaxID=95149 RepID=UPI0004847251|nr:amidohydrolase family protein [Helicobacter pametensis]
MHSLVIHNGLLCDHQGEIRADLRIQDGIITEISPSIVTAEKNSLDASNLIILPACIDLNIQITNCSQSNLTLLQEKAKRGGVGTIALNTSMHEAEFLQFFNTQSQITFASSAIPWMDNKIQEISKMRHQQALAISIQSSTPSHALKYIYDYAKFLNLSCICSLTHHLGGVSVESENSFKMGLSHIPPFIQEMEFSKFFCLANAYKIPTLLQALSEEKLFNQTLDTPWIQNEISIHHLLLNEERIFTYDPWAKITPPLTTQHTQEFFLDQISKIDMLTSLYREFSTSSKEQTFEDASSGVDCLDFYFPLLFTELVKSRRLTLSELSAKTSFNQAKFLHINAGEISRGKKADLIIIDPNQSFEISHPLYGKRELFGSIKAFFSHKTGLHKIS